MIRRGSVALLYLLTTGCGAGWQRIPGPWPGELETRQQAQPPLAVVDSLRTGDPVDGFWRSAGLGMLAMVAMLVAWCQSRRCDIGD